MIILPHSCAVLSTGKRHPLLRDYTKGDNTSGADDSTAYRIFYYIIVSAPSALLIYLRPFVAALRLLAF